MDMEFAKASAVMLGINLTYAIVAFFFGIAAFKIVDLIFLRKLDLEEEIKKNNLSAAIFASALVLAAAIIVSRALGK